MVSKHVIMRGFYENQCLAKFDKDTLKNSSL